MSHTKSAVTTVETPEKVVEKSAPDFRRQTKPRRQPPYAVVLHNDDLNTMDFVIGVLRKVFNYDLMKAYTLMHQAHTSGRCILWSGALEVAELKADQIRSAGPDPEMKLFGAGALSVSVEPLPG